MNMDGLSANGGAPQPAREPAHSHHRSSYGYPAAAGSAAPTADGSSRPAASATVPPYSAPVTQSSCAAATSGATIAGSSGRLPDDAAHKATASYSASSPSRLSGQSAVAPVPPPRSSDVRHQAGSCASYAAGSSGAVAASSSTYQPSEFMLPQTSSYHEPAKSSGPPEPPKKPLTPYMRFSKSIWFQVKATNPSLSVCQIGATIGRMWRELSESEKQRHLEEFNQDKVRYDTELKRYMKSTGLRAKDLRAMAKNQPKSKNRHRSRSSQQSTTANATVSATAGNPQLAAQAAAFMGLPITAGVPMGMLGAAAGAMGMLPPHFTQVWPGGQQYAGQQMMGIAASQLQLTAQSAGAQGLYSNGYTLAADGSVIPAKQSASGRDGQVSSSSSMYRYPQNYL